MVLQQDTVTNIKMYVDNTVQQGEGSECKTECKNRHHSRPVTRLYRSCKRVIRVLSSPQPKFPPFTPTSRAQVRSEAPKRFPFPFNCNTAITKPLVLHHRFKPHPWRIKGCGSQPSPATGSRHWLTKHSSHLLQERPRDTMEGGQNRNMPPSYLGWSIFNTLCCCLPLGIAAIVCSCKVGYFS